MAKESKTYKADIMIVDDVPANLHLMAQILITRGYQVRAFPNGSLAVAAARASVPDLVLLDVMMPEMDGYTVCRHLKDDELTRDVPVIFVSALNATSDKMGAFAAGGVDYLTKPFHPGEILARVETHLALRDLQRQLQVQNAELSDLLEERQRDAEKLRRYTQRLETMHEIDRAILAARSSSIVALAIVGRIRELIPCQRVVVMSFTEDGRVEILAAESSGSFPVRADPVVFRQLIDGHPDQIQGAADLSATVSHSPAQEALYAQGVRSYMTLPMSAHDELIGALHLDSDHPCVFTEDHINTARDIALLMALAIRQARLYEQAQQELAARNQAEAELRIYAQELETSNAELDAFAHTVAHDLKSPLTSLIMLSSFLETKFDTLPADHRTDYLASITRSGFRMNNIIQELLLLASIRKVEQIHVQELDMGIIMNDVRERVAQLSEESAATLHLPSTWPQVVGRAQWVEEIWTNFISNAIKYGGQPPRVELGWDPDPSGADASHSSIRFWVRDNGAGLTPEEQGRLFTPFTRLSQVRTEGHGLGLSIVQRIAEKLGGQVGVESAPDQGSTFWFELPQSTETEAQDER